MSSHRECRHSPSALLTAGAIGLVFMAVGCQRGPATGTISGTLQFDGKPYGDAAVIFMSLKSGAAGACDLAPEGTFKLAKPLVVGQYVVYLAPKVPAPAADGAPPPPVTVDKRIPGKYWSESSTDITVEVKPGENSYTVELRK